MADAAIFMQWESYIGTTGSRAFFSHEPLTFNSRQERLHQLSEGDRLWLVSRNPVDQQYFFVAVLQVLGRKRNTPESRESQVFGEYAINIDRSRSTDLGRRFPAEGLLRALEFGSGRPVKQGASIGQSLQTLRFLSLDDEKVMGTYLRRALAAHDEGIDTPCGLWTKCGAVFANYFIKNWNERKQPLAFLLYDPPPALRVGAPVFIHSDKYVRLIATFQGAQYISGYKPTVAQDERIAERERIWKDYREATVGPPMKSDFDEFWDGQHGVRSLFLMDSITEIATKVAFKDYGRALGWGYPMGVGYRYLSLCQSYLLLRTAGLAEESTKRYLNPMLLD